MRVNIKVHATACKRFAAGVLRTAVLVGCAISYHDADITMMPCSCLLIKDMRQRGCPARHVRTACGDPLAEAEGTQRHLYGQRSLQRLLWRQKHRDKFYASEISAFCARKWSRAVKHRGECGWW